MIFRQHDFFSSVPTSSRYQSFTVNNFQALYASKIVSYAQGFMLLKEAASIYNWELDYGSIALMWRGGCIIRSVFLGQIKKAFDSEPNLRSLLLAPFFLKALTTSQDGWRRVVATAVNLGD